MKLIHADCLKAMKEMTDNSLDSIVTDPPYGLSFMGKKWDYDVPSVEIWRECLRVLKPGGHLLSFAGSRTYHRMAVNIEDAGFEIRDQIMWVYGSGFPKSLNVGRKAEEWEGWGSALKPAHEPIVVARKPLIGTLVENVLEHGTGGLNIGACRVGDEVLNEHTSGNIPNDRGTWGTKEGYVMPQRVGRFPANFIHDGSDEVVSLFPEEKARFFYCAKASKSERNAGLEAFEDKKSQHNAGGIGRKVSVGKRLEQGKENAPMMKNIHPTVKPVELMKYLCRLVTPPQGIVLDPFMGSGTTGVGATAEGFDFIGIEMDEEYLKIAEARIKHTQQEHKTDYVWM
tara:strand:+ start:1598 stop:2620 length:1023 start_codon:yes stop_codon:yes gene_type:complete